MAVESRLLEIEEWEDRLKIEKLLDNMYYQEELHWKQRLGKNWILLGDANTHFFTSLPMEGGKIPFLS